MDDRLNEESLYCRIYGHPPVVEYFVSEKVTVLLVRLRRQPTQSHFGGAHRNGVNVPRSPWKAGRVECVKYCSPSLSPVYPRQEIF